MNSLSSGVRQVVVIRDHDVLAVHHVYVLDHHEHGRKVPGPDYAVQRKASPKGKRAQ
jgi:hypothetical protein